MGLKNTLAGRDIISCRDLSRGDAELVFRLAEGVNSGTIHLEDTLVGKNVALIFVEPSTRTFQSFYVAARMLGAEVLSIHDPEMSSIAKGETLYDTVKMIEGYGADCIVLRHPARGSARFAAEAASVPVINAGSGSQEHPTQALLDVFTIRSRLGRVDGVRIGMLGDLRYSRTIPSLCYLLSKYDGVEIVFMAPPLLQVRREVELYLSERGVTYRKAVEADEIKEVMPELDVLYVTRIQKERFPDPTEYERVRGSYVVDAKLLSYGRSDLGVMHPLPRVDELSPEVDKLPNAWYFEQARNGLPIRKALLHLVLGGVG
ncbi:MAG: aspartate carbamoyltransferase [Nitrososphaerota archaeon]